VIGSRLLAASAFGSLHGLLHSTGFEVASNLALLLTVVFWLGLAHWVYRDARRRIADPWLIATAAVLGLSVPYLGPVIYLLFRPPETLADALERATGIRALEARLGRRALQCPTCRGGVGVDFLVCPVCTTRLKQPCTQCSAALEPTWRMCPHCGSAAGDAPPQFAEPDLDEALTAEIAGRRDDATHRPPARSRTTR
jgi:double zinc ribbon protein